MCTECISICMNCRGIEIFVGQCSPTIGCLVITLSMVGAVIIMSRRKATRFFSSSLGSKRSPRQIVKMLAKCTRPRMGSQNLNVRLPPLILHFSRWVVVEFFKKWVGINQNMAFPDFKRSEFSGEGLNALPGPHLHVSFCVLYFTSFLEVTTLTPVATPATLICCSAVCPCPPSIYHLRACMYICIIDGLMSLFSATRTHQLGSSVIVFLLSEFPGI